jgi:hypothetical protein
LRQVPHGRSKTKNIAFQAQHAPQPRFADGSVVSGMPELRRTETPAQPLRFVRPL